MAKIAPCTGTTADWKSVSETLILENREIGVEIASRSNGKTYTIIRQGDGKNKFFDLPAIFDQSAYEDALATTSSNMQTVSAFKDSMNSATQKATTAATNADTATQKANAAAKACENIVAKQNTMVDTVTNKSAVLTLEDSLLCIREA